MRRRVRDGWSFRATIRAYLPELIYGANDGIVTTLAVVSGVTGADLSSRVILILGFANLFADGFSMDASDVLSERSEPDPEARPSLREASRHGVATFAGFIGAGIVPLLAYLLPWFEGARFPIACGLAGLTLFWIGAGRSLFTDRAWLRAGAEMLALGALAGAVAYGVGAAGSALVGGRGAAP